MIQLLKFFFFNLQKKKSEIEIIEFFIMHLLKFYYFNFNTPISELYGNPAKKND